MAGHTNHTFSENIDTKQKTDPENVAPKSIESSQPSKSDRGSPLRQTLVSLIANLGIINTGMVFAFSAVVLPQLQAPNSVIKIDEDEASWIASLSSASTPIGCIVSGYLMDAIGRKRSLIVTEIPIIIGWILLSTATSVELLYAGRLFVGFGMGMAEAPVRVYTAEVSQPHLRGVLGAFSAVGISLGVMLQYILGVYLSWTNLSIISTTIPILALMLMFFVPETPNYLVAHSKLKEATKSLAKLRGPTYDVDREIEQLAEFNRKIQSATKKSSLKETFDMIMSAATLKPLGILFVYFWIYQLSGTTAITFYTVDIFRESGSTMDSNTATILLGAIRLVFTVIGCIALRRYGRRPLTFLSAIGCGISMLGLGIYMYYSYTWRNAVPPIEPTDTWVPVTCIFVYTITCSLGFLVVPWVMIGEVYPQKVRGIVGGLTTCLAHLIIFIVVKTYPFLNRALYSHGSFMLYGGISLVGTIFFYVFLPETKGRSLQEIEDYFSGRTKTLKTKQKIYSSAVLTKTQIN